LTGFPDKALMAEMTARMLLEVNAVHFRADEPYRFTSGLASPVYVDCRKLISYPRIRKTLMVFAASLILREIGFEALERRLTPKGLKIAQKRGR
jgi:orotate phosphoribosyltransferase